MPVNVGQAVVRSHNPRTQRRRTNGLSWKCAAKWNPQVAWFHRKV